MPANRSTARARSGTTGCTPRKRRRPRNPLPQRCARMRTRQNAGVSISDLALERDLRHGAVGGLFDLKILPLLEFELLGDKVAREGLDHRVEIADRAIVVAARHLDLVFEGAELLLQFEEVGARL